MTDRAANLPHAWPAGLPWQLPTGPRTCSTPTGPTSAGCERPATPGRYLCAACAERLERNAHALAAERRTGRAQRGRP